MNDDASRTDAIPEATEAVLASARRHVFRALVHKAPIGVYLVDADFCVIEANPTALRAFGDRPDLIGSDYEDALRTIWPNPLVDHVVHVSRHTLLTGEPHQDAELAAVRIDRGGTEYFDWRVERIILPDGSHGIVHYFSDVSDQVASRQARLASEHRYMTLFDSIDEGFCILEVLFDDRRRACGYRFLEVNPAFERQSGLTDAVGRSITEIVPDIEPFWIDTYGAVALTGEPTRFVDRSDSLGRWFDVYAFRIGEPDERKVAVLFNDVSERKRAEHALSESVALLRHHAHHDALTGLPNRLQFEQRLEAAVAAANRHGRPFAVLFLDLDGFKAVNDEHGHACGDAVLVEIARRVRHTLRASDVLARMHGDEFVAILPELDDTRDAGSVARKLLAVVSQGIDVGGVSVHVQASIGVGLYPNDARDPRSLLRAADAAMYQAKLGGKNAVGYVIADTDGTSG